MKNNKIFLIAAAMLFTVAGYSQTNLLSSHQKRCNWDSKSKTYTNCVEQTKKCKIEINSTKKQIFLNYPNVKHVYYIQSKKVVQGKTIFHAMAETGAGSTITLNSQKKTLKIKTSPDTLKQIFYLN